MKRKIRILRILNRFNLGGPVLNASYLTRYIGDEFESRLLGGEIPKGEKSALYIPESLGIKTVVIPGMKRTAGLLNDLKAFWRICREIKEFRPDIVHCHASKAGALGRIAASVCRVPVVVHTFHGHVFEGYFNSITTKVILRIERFLAKRTHAIIAISESQKESLVTRFRIADESKFHIIPLGFRLEPFRTDSESKRKSFRAKYHLQEKEVAVGIIGRLAPIKDHAFFLRCVSEVAKKKKEMRVFVIGGGELMDELKDISLKAELTGGHRDVVTFTSWLTEMDVVMNGLDIICLTSKNEGTPVSLIEAQAAARPVISTAVGGVRDTCSDQSSILITQGDAEGYAKALEKLVSDPDLRKSMGEAGQKFANDRFALDRLVKDTRSLYFNLLQKAELKEY